MLRQVAKKKEQVAQYEREEGNWLNRVSAVREADDVASNRARIASVKISARLRDRIQEVLEKEH